MSTGVGLPHISYGKSLFLSQEYDSSLYYVVKYTIKI